MLRHICAASLVAVLILGGCGSEPKGAGAAKGVVADPPPAPPPPSSQPAATQSAKVVEPVSTPEALSWTTAAYAQDIGPKVNRIKKPAGGADGPTTAPSVSWVMPLQTQPSGATAQPVEEKRAGVVDPPATRPAAPVAVSVLATQPAATAAKAGWEAGPGAVVGQAAVPSSDQLEQQLARQIRDYPRDLSAQLEYQVLQWLRGRQVPQMDVIGSLTAEDRELIAAIMDGLSNFRTNVRGNENLLLARKARPLIELAERLRAQTSLHVSGLAVCKKVYGFGAYDPLAADRLGAGREIVVYCDVENFSSRLNDRNLWQTDITQEMILYNDRGQRVAVEKRQPFADVSRNRRHDFCVARKLQIPAVLAPGNYFLTVSVSDQQANRMAEATIPVQIVTEK